ncbi:MAG TPA: universal stress protein [Candidatus Saccharimonadales bacterium]|nr:universal stress protein [Candidatus Saccharimonadales bacterium]
MRIVVWVVEGTWQGCIDAAVRHLPADSRFTLLHVTPSDVTEAADAATAGLFGRGFPGRKPNRRYELVADDEAAKLLAAAAARLGKPDAELVSRSGRVEREVIRAVADGVDVLVVARDGDRSRLGPKSLGHATRFVVDHAPCAVMLVWPDETPGIESIPPPKHGPPPPPPHRRD